ncbi:hypothetical protein H4S08_001805 [Coemansia sp. RSA 1365]|nr:hypothetical protein H4S08_001805 [Coemansia sp. RSA 1365]
MWLLLLVQQVTGALKGSAIISYHDYFQFSLKELEFSPPSCGIPFAELDRTRITAVSALDKAVDCGKCIKVTNTDDKSKFTYVLAVDTGGVGLDLSKQAFGKLFDVSLGRASAQWEPADSSHCNGIWKPGTPIVDVPYQTLTPRHEIAQAEFSTPPVF